MIAESHIELSYKKKVQSSRSSPYHLHGDPLTNEGSRGLRNKEGGKMASLLIEFPRMNPLLISLEVSGEFVTTTRPVLLLTGMVDQPSGRR